jgi:hypothetical protein
VICAANPITNSVPWSDDFEGYTNTAPLINGTNGWYGSSANIVVQTNIFAAGTKAAMIPADCVLSNPFVSAGSTSVWVQLDLRPSLYNGTNSPVVDTNVAAMFYINSNGNFVVHNGPATNASPTNSLSWLTLTNGGVGTSGTNWVTIGVFEDFARQKWDLYANGVLVTNDIGFINPALTNFAGFDIYNGAGTSYVDNVSVTNIATTNDTPILTMDQHIGANPGDSASSYSAPTYTVNGKGAGITGRADAFRFVYLPMTGNCTIVARLTNFTGTAAANTRLGVMMRSSTNANAIEASTLYYPGSSKRVYFHRRTATNGTTVTSSVTAAALPYWMKLVRSNNVLKAYSSANGTNWTQVGANTTVTLGNPIQVGLAVTSGSTTGIVTGKFDNVSITVL